MAMKKLLLLFPFLCLLLANTELRAQVYVLPTTDNDKRKLIITVLECYQQCYSDYYLGWPERVHNCIKYYPSGYCTEERLRAIAREEYEMCISLCQVLERLLQFIP